LGELTEDSDSGWSPKTESYPRSGEAWGVLKVSAVSWDEFRTHENKQLLPGNAPPIAAQVHIGDFLMSRANTSELVAKCVIVDREPERLILSDKIVRLRLTSQVDPAFVALVNNHARYARDYFARHASGTSLSMKNVSRPVIYELPIPLPPLSEQRRIVAKINEVKAVCDCLDSQTKAAHVNSQRMLDEVLREALG
jgi:type I restriction enzyme S subunit